MKMFIYNDTLDTWCHFSNKETLLDVIRYNSSSFKIGDIVYTDLCRFIHTIDGEITVKWNEAFLKAFNQARMWEKLNA